MKREELTAARGVTWEVVSGDCLAELRKIESATVGAVVSDPPFSSGTRREGAKGIRKSMNRGVEDKAWFGTDSLTTNGFVWLMRECAREWHRVLKPGSHVLVFESADLRHAGLLVWDKTGVGSDPRRRDVGNVLSAKPIRNGLHPTEKPVGLLETLLQVVTSEGDTVLDCFAGSGSTGVAAVRQGRNFIGIERDEAYAALARHRIEAIHNAEDLA